MDNRLEVTPDDLYALIGQLNVETRLLRVRLARAEQRLRELEPEAGMAEVPEPLAATS